MWLEQKSLLGPRLYSRLYTNPTAGCGPCTTVKKASIALDSWCRVTRRGSVTCVLTSDEVVDDSSDAVETTERVDARRPDRTDLRRRDTLIYIYSVTVILLSSPGCRYHGLLRSACA